MQAMETRSIRSPQTQGRTRPREGQPFWTAEVSTLDKASATPSTNPASTPTSAAMNGWVNVTGAPVTPPSTPNPQPNYTILAVGAAIEAVVVVATLAFIVRRKKRRTSVA